MTQGSSEDPFDKLLDPRFHSAPGPKEPSARERAADARARTEARRAREAALAARLAEEQALQREQQKADRRTDRQAKVRSARRVIPGLVVLAMIGGVAWAYATGNLGDFDTPDGVADSTRITQPPRPDNYPPSDGSASTEPLGTPPPVPQNPGAFEFLANQPDSDDPVAWDPCRPIRYVVNPTGAPAGADALLADAITRTSAASGLQFESAGVTDEAWSKEREPYQPDRYGEKWAPVLIVWANEIELPGLAGYIAGLAGPQMVSDSDGTRASVTGSVALDRDQLGELVAAGRGSQARSIIQHELGHLIGLDHVADPAQLMYSESGTQPQLDWGTGDLAGLHALGTQPCKPNL